MKMDIPKTALEGAELRQCRSAQRGLVSLGLEALRRAGQVRVGRAAVLPRPRLGECRREFGSSPERCGQLRGRGRCVLRPAEGAGRGGAGRRK